jgi:tetratricopeptide (TPR) repeat protein
MTRNPGDAGSIGTTGGGRLLRWSWLLPLLSAAAVMLPTVTGQLVWDDALWGRQLPFFTSLGAVLRPPTDIPEWPVGYFRPVATLSYLLDARLHGMTSVSGWHVTNILLHVLATAGTWWLARRLLADRVAALLATMIFAVHPIHTESVGWLGARVDVLATMFLLPALLLALDWRDRRRPASLLLGSLCLLAALGSKEVAVTGIALLPLLLWLAPPLPATGHVPPERTAAGWHTWLPLAVLYGAALALYLVLRQAAGAGFRGELAAEPFWKVVQAAAFYVIKLLMPWPQSNFVPPELLPGRALAIVVVLVAVALLGVALVIGRRRRDHALTLGLLWTGAAIAPSLAIAVGSFAAAPVAERYLYLPSVGMALAAGAIVAGLAGKRGYRLAVAGLASITLVYAALCVDRSLDWSSNLRLWTTTTQRVPGHGLPWVELGQAWYAAGDHDRALAAYAEARSRRNAPGTLAVAEYQSGLIFLKRGQLAEAELAFVASRADRDDYALAHYGLGRVYYERALQPGAIAARLALLQRSALAFNDAIRHAPSFGEPRLQIVKVLLLQADLEAKLGRRETAAAAYRTGLAQLEALLRALPTLGAEAAVMALRDELREKAAGADSPVRRP